MLTLVDADIVCYRAAASAEHDSEDIALVRAKRTLQDILSVTGASDLRVFLSGSANWRRDFYPLYKANRDNLQRPKWLQHCREYLVIDWSAEVSDGWEADDSIGIAMAENSGAICASIDKDLKQIAGTHYNFVTGEFLEVSEVEGWRSFYKQLVLGDRGDNIPGYDGKMRIKFPKFLGNVQERLDRANTPYEMYEVVRGLYEDEEALIRNGKLLYIWRRENDNWLVPTKAEASSGAKPVEALKSESTQTTPVVNTPSTVRGGGKQKKGGSRQRGQSKATVSRKKRRARST